MYQLLKSMNNNIVLAKNEHHEEVILIGTGIGFRKNKYDEISINLIEKIYRTDENMNFSMILDQVPQVYLDLVDEVVSNAMELYRISLNPSIYVYLADHIYASVLREVAQTEHPLSSDIKLLYPNEFELSKKIISSAREKYNVLISPNEVSYITLHIVNAQSSDQDMNFTGKLVRITNEIANIVFNDFNMKFNTNSLAYSRFLAHVRFFVMRQRDEAKEEKELAMDLFTSTDFEAKYPKSYRCSQAVKHYLEKTYLWEISENEVIYLAIHIQRMLQSVEN